jgi:Flp pilus assembly protein TadG
MRNFIDAFASSTRQKLKAFRNNQLGSVTQMFAVAAFPMVIAAGAAIDTVRIGREHVAFNAAVDSAVLAVAADDRASLAGLSTSQQASRIAELELFARKYLTENYTPQFGNDTQISVDIDITGSSIDLTASHDFPTTIMKLTGVEEVNLTAHAQVMKAMRPIELTLVMDTTGSMSTDNKIQGAKDAAKKLLNTLYGGTLSTTPQSEYIRVALVPFAAAVRLNPSAYDFNLGWIDTTGTNPLSKLNFTDTTWNNYTTWAKLKKSSSAFHTWNGCVEARLRGTASAGTDYNVNDVAPTSTTPATRFPAYFAPDTPSIRNISSYPSSWRGYDFYGTYIPEDTTTPNEISAPLSSANATNMSNSPGFIARQKNQAKYNGRNIGVETTSNLGPWAGCAKSTIVPMTYKRSNVEAGIDAMTASGPTLIAEGLAWGMRVQSPGEPFTKVEGATGIPADTIASYGHPRWQKTVVLMTDGDNDLSAGVDTLNGTVYSAYGRGTETLATNRFGSTSSSNKMTELDNAMLEVCNKIKATGTQLYVTSFGNGVSSSTRARLQACATDADNYQHATSSADLATFFNHIGEDVINKSIYVSK